MLHVRSEQECFIVDLSIILVQGWYQYGYDILIRVGLFSHRPEKFFVKECPYIVGLKFERLYEKLNWEIELVS